MTTFAILASITDTIPTPFLVAGGVLLVLIAVGKAQRKHSEASQGDIEHKSFDDIAGCDEAIEDLADIVRYLKDPKQYDRLGAIAPKGALLSGPPGTGKTLLARAVASEAGVPFIACTGSDFVQEFVGVGAKRVRELFVKAREHDKAIIFIDEVDAIARRRGGQGGDGTGTPGGSMEHDNTLIALLSEIDGFHKNNIVVLAATNRPETLDPALLRPGRLDRKIVVGLPDRIGRESLFKVHTRKKPMAKHIDYADLSAKTGGMSGAAIAQVVNEAALIAVRTNSKEISKEHLELAVEYVVLGRPRTSAVVTTRDRHIVAWHEAGHALAASLLPDADVPVLVSIVPRGQAGGITWMEHPADELMSLKQAESRLVVALAGRAAEEIHMDGEFTQGASSDLKAATDMASLMVTRYGMSFLGLTVRETTAFYGNDTNTQNALEDIVDTAYRNAVKLLKENSVGLERLVKQLLTKETLRGEEINKAIGKQTVQPVLTRAKDRVRTMVEPLSRDHYRVPVTQIVEYIPGKSLLREGVSYVYSLIKERRKNRS